MSVAILVPSFGRPDNAHRLLEAIRLLSHTNPLVAFIVDDSDPTFDQYPRMNRLAHPGRGMVNALNFGANLMVQDDQIEMLVFLGDDHMPRTAGWDLEYLEALRAQGGGIVWGDDKIQGPRIPTQVGMDANWVRRLGWMAPPTFRHLFVDDAWLAMGKSINKATYLPHVIVEHVHPLGNAAAWDEGYERVNAPEIANADQMEFIRFKNMELRKIARQLS